MYKQILIKISSLLIIVLLFFVCCAAALKDWKAANQLNTIESYKWFLSKHQSGALADSAWFHITKLEWNKIKNLNEINKYTTFIKKYPHSEFTVKATNRLRELVRELEWEQAEKQNDLIIFILFIDSNERSPLTYQANESVRKYLDKHWKLMSENDSELIKTTIIEYIKSNYSQYSGDTIFRKTINAVVILQIVASDVLYLSKQKILLFQQC